MNKLLSLCFLALSILTATSDNPVFSFFSSPSDLTLLSSTYTEPVQEFSAGVFTLSIPSSFEKECDQDPPIIDINNNDDIAFSKSAIFRGTIYDSKNTVVILITVFKNENADSLNTLEENYKVINKALQIYSYGSPSYKSIDDYLCGLTSTQSTHSCSSDFAIIAGTDVLLTHIISSRLDDVISLRDQLMDSLKIDLPQQ